MKFQMNGCLIIGTWDGANIEIAEETGVDNVFVFGVRAEEINQLRKDRATYKTDTRSVGGLWALRRIQRSGCFLAGGQWANGDDDKS